MDDSKLKARAMVKLEKKCNMFVPLLVFTTKLLQIRWLIVDYLHFKWKFDLIRIKDVIIVLDMLLTNFHFVFLPFIGYFKS